MTFWLIPIFALLALGGGALSDPIWTGIFWCLLGIAMAAGGIRAAPPLGVSIVGLAWFLWTCLAFLPTPLDLMGTSGISPRSGFLTPQPQVTLQFLLGFAGGLLWLFWLLGNPVGENHRLLVLRWTGLTVATLGMLALLAMVQNWPLPFLQEEDKAGFGFFPNRNHMSNWLALGGLAALGALLGDARKKKWPWTILSLLAIGAILTCLAANTSRGGLLIFFVGALAWAMGLSAAGPDRRIGLGLLGLGLVAATILLVAGGKSLERLRPETKTSPPANSPAASVPEANGNSSETASEQEKDFVTDGRIRIYRDTLDLISASPWTGVGLGNFRYLFPRFRSQSFTVQAEALHPESDPLWIAAESGWPALLLGAAFVGLLFLQAAPGSNREGWATRAAAASGVLAFVLHGFVDVPGHRPGALALALLLAWLAFGRKSSSTAPPKFLSGAFRVAGAAVGLFGLLWTWGILGNADWPPSPRAEFLRKSSLENLRQGDVEPALQEASRAVRLVPLDREARYLEGACLLSFEDGEKEALASFGIERWLEPYRVRIPLAQAYMLTQVDPVAAIGLYRDALERADRFPADMNQTPFVLEQLTSRAREIPGLRPHIPSLVEGRPELLSIYLAAASPEELAVALETLLRENPALANWAEAPLRNLLTVWARRGNRTMLQTALEQNPAWWPSGWPILAQLWIQSGKTKEAIGLANQFLPPPTLPDELIPPDQAESRWYRSPRDYGAAYVLAETRRKNGDLTGARVVLEKITERPEAPAYFWWLRSRVETEEGRHTPAWESLKKYLQRAVPGWPTI